MNGQSTSGQSTSAAALAERPDAWRYRWHQGYWWYYTPQQQWLQYEHGAWKLFVMPPPVPVPPVYVNPAPVPGPARRPIFGVDS